MGFVLSKGKPSEGIIFVSLGMLVLDELRFPSQPTLYDVVGGSGAYSSLGARLFAPSPRSNAIGCIIMAGNDFPKLVSDTLHCWAMTLLMHVDAAKPSTRGLLIYEDTAFGRKTFSYVTPPLQPSPSDLESSRLLRSTAFHLLARPSDAKRQVTELLDLREKRGEARRPWLVWEPAPPFCTTANCEDHFQACKLVDVFSPNHLEMLGLFEDDTAPSSFDPEKLESYAQRFLDAGVGFSGRGAVVIRAGEHGCLTMSRSCSARWLPPFHNPTSPKVVDPTGAGNAFLGGFTVALQGSDDLTEAALHGNVAASFALEQFGLPSLEASSDMEMWNGADVSARLKDYRVRLAEESNKSAEGLLARPTI